MKKWIWSFFVLLIIIAIYLTNTYFQAIQPIKIAKERAEKITLDQTDIVNVQSFEEYHGVESISVVKGKNQNGEVLIAWIPENEQNIVVMKETQGIKASEAVKKVKQLSNPKKIIDVRLGMEKGIPLWEIYYLSNAELINYFHVDFVTGEWLKRIENL
jgi:uncharacterized protein YpmB